MHFSCKNWKYCRWALNPLNNQPHCLMCFSPDLFQYICKHTQPEYLVLRKWSHAVHVVLQLDFPLIACLETPSVTIPTMFCLSTSRHSRACPDPSWLRHPCVDEVSPSHLFFMSPSFSLDCQLFGKNTQALESDSRVRIAFLPFTSRVTLGKFPASLSHL